MADRGRKALPVDNRLCHQRRVERCQKIHQEKLKNMKSTAKDPRLTTLNNSSPKLYKHLLLKMKKTQLDEERYAQIERENEILLGKMTKIMKMSPKQLTPPLRFRSCLQIKPGVRLDTFQYPVVDNYNFAAPKSLNAESRVREMKRIEFENEAMLQRITSRQPFYNHLKWEEERQRDLKYLENIRSREITANLKSKGIFPPIAASRSSKKKPDGIKFNRSAGELYTRGNDLYIAAEA